MREETGILLSQTDLTKSYLLDKTTYFYIERISEIIDANTLESDITGITWIHPDCLLDMITDNRMCVNYHCRKCIAKFLGLPSDKYGCSPIEK